MRLHMKGGRLQKKNNRLQGGKLLSNITALAKQFNNMIVKPKKLFSLNL